MTTITEGRFRPAISLGITDLVALITIYMIPTISHYAPFPIYLLDPMRIVILGTLLLNRNWKNSLILAATLPIFSFFVAGHPIFPKCIIMAVELSANVLLITWFSKSFTYKVGISTFISIMLSKCLYYAMKAIIIATGIIEMSIISTDILVQMLVAIMISIAFTIVNKR